MAGTLAIIAALAQETTFMARVKAAMMTAAVAVAAEVVGAQDTSVYQKRHQLAVAILNNPDQYAARFAWAAATNSTIAGEVGAPVAIASSTAADPAVITTATAHGYATGDQVTIAGHAANIVLNGCWTVTVLTATTFSVPVLGTAAGLATGTAAKQPPDSDIQFACNSLFSSIAGVGRYGLNVRACARSSGGDSPGFRLLWFNCNCLLGLRGYCPHDRERDVNSLFSSIARVGVTD